MEQSKSGTKEGDIGFIFGLFVEKESHFPQPASFCKKQMEEDDLSFPGPANACHFPCLVFYIAMFWK